MLMEIPYEGTGTDFAHWRIATTQKLNRNSDEIALSLENLIELNFVEHLTTPVLKTEGRLFLAAVGDKKTD